MKTVRRITVMLAVVIAAAVLMQPAIQHTRKPHLLITGELPEGTQLLHHHSIRHGIDHCELFAFDCQDSALRENLVRKYGLWKLAANSGEPLSFVHGDQPEWWKPESPSTSGKYSVVDESREAYVSMWEQADSRRLFVEVGRW